MRIQYEIQYSPDKRRIWVHSSTGETVGRYDVRFGMDIHTTMEEQMNGASQCLHCTHGKSNPNEFDEFCDMAKELWGVTIDKRKISFE